ncbi:PqqD family protein [Methylomonas methanica]|uniref:Coenzyme PQQ synthesis protein D (PqqD) n=1 Tax=Methylomonas methanica (strain DSM 25384 / MC09) TaxID=857087 RepID=F9ZVK0_METMM|nr:PqqD family protein [Methylomonas methanica]AEG01982.1 hypothetical protein Metme_3621 [Methylomonas methanica MC09]
MTRIRQLLSLSSAIRRSENSLSAEVDDTVVLMSIQQGAYYSLDSIGAEIWRRLDRPMLVTELCAILKQEYDAEPTTIQRDVLALLESLDKECLIEIVPEPTAR